MPFPGAFVISLIICLAFCCFCLSGSCHFPVVLELPRESLFFLVIFCHSQCPLGIWCHFGIILESGVVSETTKMIEQ